MMILWYPYIGTGDLLQNVTYIVFHALLRQLASSGPYGPLLARSGYPRQDASFYNNPLVMICATVLQLSFDRYVLLEMLLSSWKQFYASSDGFVQQEMLLCG